MAGGLSLAAKVEKSLDEICAEEAWEQGSGGGRGWGGPGKGYTKASGRGFGGFRGRGLSRGRGWDWNAKGSGKAAGKGLSLPGSWRRGRGSYAAHGKSNDDAFGALGAGSGRGKGYAPATHVKGLGRGKGRWQGFARSFLGVSRTIAPALRFGRRPGEQRLRRWGPRNGQGAGGLLGLPFSGRTTPYATDRSIFFTNAPTTTTFTELTRLFEKVGSLSKVTLFTLPDGSSRGMGIAEYTSAEAADAAYKSLHNTDLDGRALVVDRYAPPELL
mmetsp:Transcript_92878/g.271884  ORF Transcript_92878/g.271884 Transcript_92878/m.271884 type:complete len:272 (+) Transcript_92878:95-910(+)